MGITSIKKALNHQKRRGYTVPFVNAVVKYGYENFERTILEYFNTPEEAYLKEEEIVDHKWIMQDYSYNVCLGGKGGNLGEIVNEKRRGEKAHNAVITDAQALEVFEYLNKTDLSLKDIAKELSISEGIVKSIHLGVNWKHLGVCCEREIRRKLTKEKVREIRFFYLQNKVNTMELAKHYNKDYEVIRRILTYTRFNKQDVDIRDQIFNKYRENKCKG
jgi:hypothetical protein